jgi:hypothetical protein
LITTLIEAAQAVANNIGKVINTGEKIASYQKDQSLSEFARLTQVEPIVVISKDLINLDYMPDVMQSVLSIFAGYYMQAVSIITAIDSIKIIKTLDRLNPDRDSSGYLLTVENISTQLSSHYKYKLPSMEDGSNLFTSDSKDQSQASYKVKTVSDLNETVNLAVGKLVQITFKESKGSEVVVDVRIRLTPVVLSNMGVEKIIVSKTDDISLTERYHAWRSGRIKFIRDLIFCQDLIDEKKKAIMNDEEGVYSEIIRRVNNSKKYGLLSSNPSLVSASSIFIISEELARQIEIKFGGSLGNKRVMDKVFENTYAMMLIVVDREYDRVSFYTRGIHASSDFSIKEIKAANKGRGIDIGDVLKTFTMGQAPSF